MMALASGGYIWFARNVVNPVFVVLDVGGGS
jgi:hypothetical protein